FPLASYIVVKIAVVIVNRLPSFLPNDKHLPQFSRAHVRKEAAPLPRCEHRDQFIWNLFSSNGLSTGIAALLLCCDENDNEYEVQHSAAGICSSSGFAYHTPAQVGQGQSENTATGPGATGSGA